MRPVRLEPAHNLLEELELEELHRLADACGVAGAPRARKAALVEQLSRHIDIDGIVERLPGIFSKQAPAGVKPAPRLDRVVRRTGPATIQVPAGADAQLGELLLRQGRDCLLVRLAGVQLFLDNRWPVLVRVEGRVPANRLFAAFIRRGRLHPSAEAPPPPSRPFILDEGEYGLRRGRLRLDLARSGPVSFNVKFLRFRQSGAAEHLLLPIA